MALKNKNKRASSRAGRSSQDVWLYGVHPVREALRAGSGLREIYLFSGRRKRVGELMDEAAERGVPVKVIYDTEFFEGRFPKGHQGVAARAEPQEETATMEKLLSVPAEKGETPFFVVLDGIEDPRNLGAILRSAEAAGVHGVVVQERRSAPLGPEARKASAGASEHIPLCVLPNIKNAFSPMKDAGVVLIGAEAGLHSAPWDVDLLGPVALVVGSEGRGLRRTVAEKCDFLVSLPLKGKVGSLNASVSAGVLFYEVLRQRTGEKAKS
jgi:23S rRNA (guanosine2251-2'-O)-methyltransferase